MSILLYFIIAELSSISISFILHLSGDLRYIVKNFDRGYDDKFAVLVCMAIFLGWFIFPYFAWLCVKQSKYSKEKKQC